MKIIQANIWGGKLGFQIIDFLKAENPDFVCLQEVNSLKGPSGYGFFATLDEIKEKAGFSDVFMSPTYSARYMERTLEYGNAILSKFPLVSTKTIFTGRKFINNFDATKNGGNIRNLQLAKAKVNGTSLNILNHHGYHIPDSKAGNKETVRQIRTVADVIDLITGPLIFCGDLNLAPDSQSIAVINDKLTNLSAKYKLQRTYSWLSNVDAVCDYIFVNDQVKVRNFKMSDELISDHNALILDFNLLKD